MTAEGLLLLSAAILAGSFFTSGLKWVAVPLAGLGLALAPDRAPLPELLVFEDGKEIATLGAEGELAFLRKRPNDFVAQQWEGAYMPGISPGSGERRSLPADCEDGFCRFTTRSGVRVTWTDDYEKTGQACDEGDVAIVARAIRLTACRSGAALMTLRTLRRSGSVAIGADPAGGSPTVVTAIEEPLVEWNRHRAAPWPEYWRKPAEDDAPAAADLQHVPARSAGAGSASTAIDDLPKPPVAARQKAAQE